MENFNKDKNSSNKKEKELSSKQVKMFWDNAPGLAQAKVKSSLIRPTAVASK